MNTLNPVFFRDEPSTICKDQGVLNAVFYTGDNEYPALVPFELDDIELTVDLSQVKSVWQEEMRDDLISAIDKRFGNFFLSSKDLTLNVIGL